MVSWLHQENVEALVWLGGVCNYRAVWKWMLRHCKGIKYFTNLRQSASNWSTDAILSFVLSAVARGIKSFINHRQSASNWSVDPILSFVWSAVARGIKYFINLRQSTSNWSVDPSLPFVWSAVARGINFFINFRQSPAIDQEIKSCCLSARQLQCVPTVVATW